MNAPSAIEHNNSALELEQGLIGASLTNQDVFSSVAGILDPEHFSEQIHQNIWLVMLDLLQAGRVANPVTLGLFIPFKDELRAGQTIGQYVAQLCADTFCPASAAVDFAKQIRAAWGGRQTLAAVETARAGILSYGADTRGVILDLMRDLDETRSRIDPHQSGFKSAEHVATAVIDRAAAQYQGTAAARAIPTGVKDLDHILGGGLHPSDLVILAGRPGMGKSVAAVSFSRHAVFAGHAGGLYSLEMTLEQIGSRYLTDLMFDNGSRLKSGQVFNGKFSQSDFEKTIEASRVFATLPLEIDDSSRLSVGEISARTRSMANKLLRKGKRLEFIYIDYLKFVKATDRYKGQRHYEIGEISSGLKSLAKDLDIAVVLLAQLNRDVEKRDDKRPQLSDLRESGDLEADADKVIMLFREEYYHAMKQPKEADREAFAQWMEDADRVHNRIEFLVEKNRMGATGKVDAFCDVGASAIRDLARNDYFPARVA